MFSFFEQMRSNYETNQIINECETIIDRIEDIVKPVLENIVEAHEKLGSYNSRAPMAVEFEKKVRKTRNSMSSADLKDWSTMLMATVTRLTKSPNELLVIIKRYFSGEVAKEGMTYKQINILRLVDLMNFFTRYAMKFIDYVTSTEADLAGIKIKYKALAPIEQQWLEDNLDNFVKIWFIFTDKNVTIEEAIKESSTLIVSESNGMVGDNKRKDPLNVGFMPILGDFFKFVGLQYVRIQNDIYEAEKARLVATQLRLQALKQKQEEGDVDPAILKQIEYYTELAQKLEYEIAKYEEKAGV